MNETIQRLMDKTGLPEDKATAAVDAVVGFLARIRGRPWTGKGRRMIHERCSCSKTQRSG
jgi:hypothetical protein